MPITALEATKKVRDVLRIFFGAELREGFAIAGAKARIFLSAQRHA
jgi:hypothetical protein